jgi:glycosyltransferase involved in cell wall biosynthesis
MEKTKFPVSIAVIIPAYNSSSMLSAALRAIKLGTRQPDELWVVDDASQDNSGEVAAALGASVLKMENNVGPAACRNRAAIRATSSILVFFDADTWVHADTLERIEAHFTHDSTLGAVIGAYDDMPREQGLISQYRNLAHCYIHRSSSPNALTFWTGCGAVRRDVFLRAEGFDERYRRPSVEDIEFGYRLSGQGEHIRLDPSIVVKHAKRWTISTALVTDLWDRGIPWMVLLLQRGSMPDDLNIRMRNRASTAMTGLALMCGAFSHYSRIWLVLSFVLLVAALCLHAGMFRFIAKRRVSMYPVAWGLFLLGELCNLVSIAGGAFSWLFAARRGERSSCVSMRTLSEAKSEVVSG